MSVVIAPEGTRSLTPRLGQFKKGAFHIAMQAGAPIVPVVIRNTYEVMPRGSLLFRPGTVQVCALPAIDVTTWKVGDLDRHVAEVQALFQRTLDDWPGSRARLSWGTLRSSDIARQKVPHQPRRRAAIRISHRSERILKRNREQRIDQPAVDDHGLFGEKRAARRRARRDPR